jgi:benzoate-CoA ligase
MFISNRPGAVKPGSSGQPVPGYEAAIVDERGAPVARGDIGNLRIKGDSIMAGYWNQPEKTKATLLGDWIETGDKYYQDSDGYYWYCGRSDDMLKVKGAWVSPAEVESALIQHPAVLQAAVVGHKDAEGLIKAKAFVVLKDPSLASDALSAELMTFTREKLAPYKCPRWVEFRTDLPMTATGKIQRFKLRS